MSKIPLDAQGVEKFRKNVKRLLKFQEEIAKVREDEKASEVDERRHDLKKTLGLKIYIERKKAGLTQKQCADKSSISASTWGHAESGSDNVGLPRYLEF